MSHLYQPLMLRTLIDKGGTASLHDIASAFLTHDESQIEYYIEITERMPVLTCHQLVERDGDGYRLIPDVQQLSRQERDRLLRLCDEALETYTGRRGVNVALPTARSQGAGIPAARQFRGITRRNAMKMLATLLATAALVAGVTIANAQSSGSPTQPAGPKAGGHDPNNSAGVRTTVQVARGAAATLPPPGSSGSPTQPAGAMAGGMKPQR